MCVELAGNWSGVGDARRDPGNFTVTTRAVSSAGRASPEVAQQWTPDGVAMSQTLTLTGALEVNDSPPAQPAVDPSPADRPPVDPSPADQLVVNRPLLFGGAVRGAPLSFPADPSGLLDAALGPALGSAHSPALARPSMPIDTLVTLDDTWSTVAASAVEVVLAADTFSATFVLHTARGDIAGTATGEADFAGNTWRLRGASEITHSTFAPEHGSASPARGGFVANLRLGGDGSADDVLKWRLDAQSHPQ